VVGSADAGSGTEVAVAWVPNGGGWDVTPLDPPGAGGSCAEATAINAANDVAGNCTTAGGAARGAVWPWNGSGWGEAVVLAPRPGDLESAVYALNDHPLAAGRSGSAEDGLAVLWNLGDPVPTVPALAPRALAWLTLACAASGWLALRMRQGRGRTRTRGGTSGGSPST
jgi:hypothetical protein